MRLYPPISIVPGGAMMFCESTSEFDPNAVQEEPAPTPEQAAEIHASIVEDIDPVMKAINHLRPVYDSFIGPVMRMRQSFDDPSDAIPVLERIISGTSTAMNIARAGVVHGNAVLDFCRRGYLYEPFVAHKGRFMTKAQQIHRQGIETHNYNYSALPAFDDRWATNGTISALCAAPELLDEVLFASSLSTITGEGDPLNRNFDGFVDMLQCVFTDPDRMARLEANRARRIDFDDIMRNDRYAFDDCPSVKQDTRSEVLLSLMSSTIRCVSRTCYNTICDITDGKISSDVVSDRIRPMLNQIVNVFGLAVLSILTNATVQREYVARSKAIQEYTIILLNAIK